MHVSGSGTRFSDDPRLIVVAAGGGAVVHGINGLRLTRALL